MESSRTGLVRSDHLQVLIYGILQDLTAGSDTETPGELGLCAWGRENI